MFYEQLLHVQIPKVQKNTDGLTVFLVLLGSFFVKAFRMMVDEIDTSFVDIYV